MTSSLVGSEMCIRDSSTTEEEGGYNHQYSRLEWVYGPYGWKWEWRWSVSYTHLTLPTICSV
eukprot:6959687-Prorocentrum_lima.AAC.1